MGGVVFKGKNFLFMMLALMLFKKFENTFVIWPYEDQNVLGNKKYVYVYVYMYVCMYVYLFVCFICVSLHLETSKM